MLYALSWFVVGSLIVLWSILAWALHAVAVWAVSSAGALSGSSPGMGAWLLPDWLTTWVPPELVTWTDPWLVTLADALDGLLQAMPGLAGFLTVVSWGVWGVGTALLMLVGTGLHLLTALWRRHAGTSPSSAGAPLLAAR